MILRLNKKLVDEFLADLGDQVSEASVRSTETHLRAFLEYLGETPLDQCTTIVKGYKNYLRSGMSRRDGKG
jgi:hypothetical protein